MAAKIPQDVTREDRLVGPLTLRQFLYVLGGGALVFVTYQYYAQGYLYFAEFLVIAFILTSLTLALTFANINGRPFGLFMIYFYHFIRSPKLLIWDKSDVAPLAVTGLPKVLNVASEEPSTKNATVGQLEILAKVLDTGGKMNENISNENRIGNVGTDIKPVAEPEVEDVLENLG